MTQRCGDALPSAQLGGSSPDLDKPYSWQPQAKMPAFGLFGLLDFGHSGRVTHATYRSSTSISNG